ncbi:hypothetical protein CS8_087220 [Cupriavidus sp. 8B]
MTGGMAGRCDRAQPRQEFGVRPYPTHLFASVQRTHVKLGQRIEAGQLRGGPAQFAGTDPDRRVREV